MKLKLSEIVKLSLKANKIKFVGEYKFHSQRRWRFDFAIPPSKIAIEVEGGVWISGRHTRGSGFVKDCEKYNNATALGWQVFRVCNEQHLNFVITFLKTLKKINTMYYLSEKKKGTGSWLSESDKVECTCDCEHHETEIIPPTIVATKKIEFHEENIVGLQHIRNRYNLIGNGLYLSEILIAGTIELITIIDDDNWTSEVYLDIEKRTI